MTWTTEIHNERLAGAVTALTSELQAARRAALARQQDAPKKAGIPAYVKRNLLSRALLKHLGVSDAVRQLSRVNEPTGSMVVVGPEPGTFPNHPWDRVTPRCEHGVVTEFRYPKLDDKPTPLTRSVLGSHVLPEVCSGCHSGVTSSGPRWTAPTVESFSSRTVVKSMPWRKDKPWQGTPQVTPTLQKKQTGAPVTQAISQHLVVARPTGQVILVSPTPRTTPYNTVTKCGELVSDIEWQSRTPGRELDRAFDAKMTLTSLDKDFTGDEDAELNSDGDDIAPFEASESMTMNRPGVDEHVEHVVLGKKLPQGIRTPARSYFERETTEYHSAEMLGWLPDDFTEESLGIHNKVDALVMYVVAQAITGFDLLDEERNDERVVNFVRRHANEYAAPSAGSFVSAAIERAVRMRLRKITLHQVRQYRECLQAQKIA